MTSPSETSLIEVPNVIADHAIIDQPTTADMVRQQIRNQILATGQLARQNLRYAAATNRWTYTHVGRIQ